MAGARRPPSRAAATGIASSSTTSSTSSGRSPRRTCSQHGVVWPPTIAGDVPLVEAVPRRVGDRRRGRRRGAWVSRAHRIAPVTRLLRSPRPLRWRVSVRRSARCAPPGARTARAPSRGDGIRLTWLRPARSRLLLATLIDAGRARRAACRSRRACGWSRGGAPRCSGHATAGSSPSAVRRASCRARCSTPTSSTRWPATAACSGRGDRTAVLRALAPDLLPDEVLARTSKATFTGATWGATPGSSPPVDRRRRRHRAGRPRRAAADVAVRPAAAADGGAAAGGVARDSAATPDCRLNRHVRRCAPRRACADICVHRGRRSRTELALASVSAVKQHRTPGGGHDTYETPAITELGSVADFTRGSTLGLGLGRLQLPRGTHRGDTPTS